MRDITVLVTASGAPGTAALIRALRMNGERGVRVVGADMSPQAIGRHFCDRFYVVPPGRDAGFADALLDIVRRENIDCVLPQSSFDLLELLPEEGGPDLLVMELAHGRERTVDGIARSGQVLLAHAKTRESMRAGLAMYFETLNDHWLQEVAQRIVSELGIEYFFNIQLVGDVVIEINPRISTIVYQEDLNLPYLGVKSALGEISREELALLGARVRPTRRALRYFDQVEWDESSPADMQTPPRSWTPSSTLE